MAQGEGDPVSPWHSALAGDGTFAGLQSACRDLGDNTGFSLAPFPTPSQPGCIQLQEGVGKSQESNRDL